MIRRLFTILSDAGLAYPSALVPPEERRAARLSNTKTRPPLAERGGAVAMSDPDELAHAAHIRRCRDSGFRVRLDSVAAVLTEYNLRTMFA